MTTQLRTYKYPGAGFDFRSAGSPSFLRFRAEALINNKWIILGWFDQFEKARSKRYYRIAGAWQEQNRMGPRLKTKRAAAQYLYDNHFINSI